MKAHFKPLSILGIGLVMIAFGISCGSGSSKNKENPSSTSNPAATEFFSVQIDGKTWEAFPSKEFHEYNVSYKELSKQFSIFAEASDGSRMDLSFHAVGALAPGNYPSTKNDNGILSGVFYYPTAKSSDRELGSITFDVPVQENTVQISKIDRSNPKAYIIEGTFSPVMYALYETNPVKSTPFKSGKFRVIYRPDSMHPTF